jgi:hypothetical protein
VPYEVVRINFPELYIDFLEIVAGNASKNVLKEKDVFD